MLSTGSIRAVRRVCFCGAGYSEILVDEASDAFTGIYHKDFRPAGGVLIISHHYV